MIAGYQLNVCFYEAMELFEVLLKEGNVTLLSALSAVLGNRRWIHSCMVKNGFELHGLHGLVDQAHELFMEMQIIGNWNACSHAGMAKSIIERMPVTVRPNKAIWMSLLCGARTHGNLEIGEYAA
ncbi:hypothetical protein L195_g050385 [Trifolium pratense]|uniref:Pentatricopeptide repeat-containing protein n=1 Tax=Trifolium pratense TaxID=57577 RepID=A0A2K3JTT7_TRIPR|nr:hypothetical protein L195_g050385 [Trifolium pratense]